MKIVCICSGAVAGAVFVAAVVLAVRAFRPLAKAHPKTKWKRSFIYGEKKANYGVWRPRGESARIRRWLLWLIPIAMALGWVAAWLKDHFHWPELPPLMSIMVAGLLPVAYFMARDFRRRKRWRAKRCIYCGYDLRASHGRCPECGRCIHSPKAPRGEKRFGVYGSGNDRVRFSSRRRRKRDRSSSIKARL